MSHTKESILNYADAEIVEYGKLWGDIVYLRSMFSDERDAFEREVKATDFQNIRAKFLVRVICDAEGNRLFTDADASALGKKNAKLLEKLFSKAQKLSHLTDEDVEELKKN